MAVRAGHKEDLDELEKRLDELRRRYDLYFHGSPEQRMPPSANQAKLGGELRRIREEEIRTWNTVDKFRFNQIFARYVSMDRMWARTLKQIEEGTYKRDKFKVGQMKKRDEEEAAPEQPSEQPQATQVGKRPASIDGLDVDVGSSTTTRPSPRSRRSARWPIAPLAPSLPDPLPAGAGATACPTPA